MHVAPRIMVHCYPLLSIVVNCCPMLFIVVIDCGYHRLPHGFQNNLQQFPNILQRYSLNAKFFVNERWWTLLKIRCLGSL